MFEYRNSPKIEFEAQGDQHSGDYRCEAKNSVGTQPSNTHRVDVHYPPKEVKIDSMPQVDIEEGESLVLQCSSKGNPETHYQWFKQPLTTVFKDGKQLQFNVVRLENAGAYYCSAGNMLGSSKSSPVTLNVQYAPKDVQLAIENDQLPIKEKDTVLLNCSFGRSNPSNNIKYKWYKANSRLPSKENLLNFPANLEQAGDYRCEVCNTIKCGSSPPVTVDIHYAPKGVTAVAEQRIPINEGNRVNLRCEVASANPEVFSYRWYKDVAQQPVDSEAAELTIYHVTSADSGRYWCEATNSVATSRSQQLLLKVYYGPRNISLSLERQVPVTEGMDVSFLCATDANPPPYYFELYHNKEMLLKASDRILLLQKVKVEDSGDYHCKASNGISTGKSQTLMFSVSCE
uniref:Uncharacterized protein n=2 Tax=Sphaerodactylus townsendi TaxID=933632 RepID=A0ACB8FS51_9SAUR